MSLEHFFTREFTVKLGGRAIGPLFFGGHHYTVGPISALRYIELRNAVGSVLGALWDGKAFKGIEDVLVHYPIALLRPLALLVVQERIRARDLARLTPAQFTSAWAALSATNDFEYIEKRLAGDGQGGSDSGPDLGLGHMAMAVVRICAGRYAPHEALTEIPIQTFLAILDAETDIRRAVDPEEAAKIHDSDLEWFQEHYPEQFEEVN